MLFCSREDIIYLMSGDGVKILLISPGSISGHNFYISMWDWNEDNVMKMLKPDFFYWYIFGLIKDVPLPVCL